MQKALAFAARAAAVIFVVAMVSTAIIIGYAKLQGIDALSIQSASMSPAIRSGDLVLVQSPHAQIPQLQAGFSELRVGDIVNFDNPENTAITITHRVIETDKRRGLVVTKGDSSSRPDLAIPATAINGKVFLIIPSGGVITDFFRTPTGLVLAVYLPAIVIAASEVKRLMRHYSFQQYELYRRLY